MTRWMRANTGTISASYHFKRHRETDGCSAGSPCMPEDAVRMYTNHRLPPYHYHGKPHDMVDECHHWSCAPQPAEPAVEIVTVAVPKTGVHVVENGKLLDTAQRHTTTRTVADVWRFELEAKRELPFFEEGKRYKQDGSDKWFKVAYVDKHPETGEDTAHGWFEYRYDDERRLPNVCPGVLTSSSRSNWSEV